MKIQDIAGSPSRRVDNFNRTLDIAERWYCRLEQVITSIREEIAGTGRRLRRHNINLGLEDLRYELDDMLQQRRKGIGQRHFYVLETSYLQFALSSDSELADLYKQFNGE